MIFDTRNHKKFPAGYYTVEPNYGKLGQAVYVLVYTSAFAKKNPTAVNNCSLMLYFFNALPEGAQVFDRAIHGKK